MVPYEELKWATSIRVAEKMFCIQCVRELGMTWREKHCPCSQSLVRIKVSGADYQLTTKPILLSGVHELHLLASCAVG